jgi:hypothetical protein
MLHAGFFLGLFFDHEDDGDMFLRNVSWFSTDYMMFCPRRQNSWNPVQNHSSYLFQNHFNIVIPFIYWFSKRPPSFRISYQNSVSISLLSHTGYMTCPSHSCFDHPNLKMHLEHTATWIKCERGGGRSYDSKRTPLIHINFQTAPSSCIFEKCSVPRLSHVHLTFL